MNADNEISTTSTDLSVKSQASNPGADYATETMASETVEMTEAGLDTVNSTYERDDLSVFFGIGIVVNLTMFVVLVVWGYRQWKKQDERRK